MKINIPIKDRIVTIDEANMVSVNQTNIDLIDDKYFADISILADHDYKTNAFVYYSLYQNYFMALEAMFSMLASTIQAPYYFYSWLLNYRNQDLFDVVNIINTESSLPNSHSLKNLSWEAVSDIIHPNIKTDNDKLRNNNFALVWRKLASDFLSPAFKEGYNSIKHGFRARKGAIKEVRFDDLIFNGSDYGLEFGIKESHDNYQIIKYMTININPKIFDYVFGLVNATIVNIKNYLKLVNIRGKVEIEQFELNNELVQDYLNLEGPSIVSLKMNTIV